MQQRVVTVDQSREIGGSRIESHTTVWRLGDRVFHTFAYQGNVLDVESFPVPRNQQTWPLERIAAATWHGTVKA